MKTIKEETPQFINNLLLELIHYYMKSIGQSINKDEQMVNKIGRASCRERV